MRSLSIVYGCSYSIKMSFLFLLSVASSLPPRILIRSVRANRIGLLNRILELLPIREEQAASTISPALLLSSPINSPYYSRPSTRMLYLRPWPEKRAYVIRAIRNGNSPPNGPKLFLLPADIVWALTFLQLIERGLLVKERLGQHERSWSPYK